MLEPEATWYRYRATSTVNLRATFYFEDENMLIEIQPRHGEEKRSKARTARRDRRDKRLTSTQTFPLDHRFLLRSVARLCFMYLSLNAEERKRRLEWKGVLLHGVSADQGYKTSLQRAAGHNLCRASP